MPVLALAAVAIIVWQADIERFRSLIRLPQIELRTSFRTGDGARAIGHTKWTQLDKKGKARTGVEDLEWLEKGNPEDLDARSQVAKAALPKSGLDDAGRLRLLVLAGSVEDADKLEATLPKETKAQMAGHATYWVDAFTRSLQAQSMTEEQKKTLPKPPPTLSECAVHTRELLERIDSKPWAFDESVFNQLRTLAVATAAINPSTNATYALPAEKAASLVEATDENVAANAIELLIFDATANRSAEKVAALRKAVDRLTAIVAKLPPESRALCAMERVSANRILGDDEAGKRLLEQTISDIPVENADRPNLLLFLASMSQDDKSERLVADQRKVKDLPSLRKIDAKLLFAAQRWSPLNDVLDAMSAPEEKTWAETARKALALYQAQTPQTMGQIVKDISDLANQEGLSPDVVADRIYLLIVGCAMIGRMEDAKKGLESLKQWEADYPGIDALAKAVDE